MTDAGEADPRLASALLAGTRAEVLAALVDARVFAAISAASTAEHVTEHGLRAESSAEMSVLLLQQDGARALPVFTEATAVRRWRLEARPVRLTGAEACRAALEEGAEAVVLDPGGAAVVLDATELATLAQGWVPVPGSAVATRHAEVALTVPATVPDGLVGQLAAALQPERLRAARLLEGPEGLVLGVVLRRPLGPAALAALAQRVVERLGAQLPAEGLDLAQVPLRGPGLPVVRRGLFGSLRRH